MIVGNYFNNDVYDKVKWIQHDVYPFALSRIFREAKYIYMKSTQILNVDTEISEHIAGINGFDHRVLQVAHDLIAAHFRYIHKENFHPDLFEQDFKEDERIKKLWLSWLEEELKRLYEEPVIVRSICAAVAFQNSEKGYKAENLLYRVLMERYPEIERSKTKDEG